MADTKVTALTQNTTPETTDILYMVDDPGGTPLSQKVTIEDILAQHTLTESWFVPMSGITDNQFKLTGELRDVSTGETGDYATDFGVGNQHLFILVNTIVTGGDLVITGTSIAESTAIPVTSDTETITIDTTADQYYQSDKKWLEITNIDVSSGTIASINYDVGIVGYMDMGNRDFQVLGYRAEFRATSNQGDIRLEIIKVQDDGAKKMSIVRMECIGIDSTSGNGEVIDSLRTGGNDRSYTSSSNIWANNAMFGFKHGDFSTYFSSDENILESSSKAEGIIIQFSGEPSGGLSNVDHGTISLYLKIG